MNDFRDSKYYISNEATDPKGIEKIKKNTDEINAYVVAEDFEDLKKNKQKYLW